MRTRNQLRRSLARSVSMPIQLNLSPHSGGCNGVSRIDNTATKKTGLRREKAPNTQKQFFCASCAFSRPRVHFISRLSEKVARASYRAWGRALAASQTIEIQEPLAVAKSASTVGCRAWIGPRSVETYSKSRAMPGKVVQRFQRGQRQDRRYPAMPPGFPLGRFSIS